MKVKFSIVNFQTNVISILSKVGLCKLLIFYFNQEPKTKNQKLLNSLPITILISKPANR